MSAGAVMGGRRAGAGAAESGWAPWLDPGEKVLWEGAPGGGLRWRRSDWLMVPFSLLWCGFAVFWTVMAASEGAPAPMVAFGAGFVCIGLYLVVGRFFWDAYKRGLTRYALTDRRALIATRHAGRRLRSWPIGADTAIDVETGPTTSIYFATERVGGGDVEYAEDEYVSWRGRRRRARHRRVGFEFLADGPAVLSLIRGAQQGEAGRA
jgi:hypothetical protein